MLGSLSSEEQAAPLAATRSKRAAAGGCDYAGRHATKGIPEGDEPRNTAGASFASSKSAAATRICRKVSRLALAVQRSKCSEGARGRMLRLMELAKN